MGAPGCGYVAREFMCSHSLLPLSASRIPTPAHSLYLSWLQTYIGNVLISVNPYQQLPIYGPEFIAKYRDYTFYELTPHM